MTDAEREYLIIYLIGYLLGRRPEARISPKNAVIRSPSCGHHAVLPGCQKKSWLRRVIKFCLAISKAVYTLCFNATSR